jgi:hypothetical protein
MMIGVISLHAKTYNILALTQTKKAALLELPFLL